MRSSLSSKPPGRDVSRGTLPRVLAYHKVTAFELGGTWLSAPRFIRQIDSMLESGRRFIDEDAFLAALDGERASAAEEVLLTFDDGYRELLDRAIPALEARKVRALIFLPSAYVGRENSWELALPGRRFEHLGWDEARDLARRGFSFGSHARTHRDLTRLDPAAVREELVRSKEEIESRLGLPVRSLSYPFGRVNGVARGEAERARYSAAFSLYPPRAFRRDDRFALRREAVYVIDTTASVRAKLGGGIPFLLEDVKGRSINACAVLTPLVKAVAARARRMYRPR